MREVTVRYEDPLDRVWTECAARVGLRVVRAADTWASTDGRGTLSLAPRDALDADDCVAQMVFHELCHWLVQGAESLKVPDWGLDNQSDVGTVREHACLRLQALLASRHGLRAVLAPTTDYRAFYDGLGDDPLGDDESSRLARVAAARAQGAPWHPHLEQALAATEQVVRVTQAFAGGGDWLFSRLAEPQPLHPSGFPLGAGGGCGTCAWRSPRGFCAQGRRQVAAALPSCQRWEAASALDCQACGACCREGYDTVEVGAREKVRALHPDLVTTQGGRANLRRTGPHCAALEPGPDGQAHHCRIYADRPKSCRDLLPGSHHCLVARRRVGLSR